MVLVLVYKHSDEELHDDEHVFSKVTSDEVEVSYPQGSEELI